MCLDIGCLYKCPFTLNKVICLRMLPKHPFLVFGGYDDVSWFCFNYVF